MIKKILNKETIQLITIITAFVAVFIKVVLTYGTDYVAAWLEWIALITIFFYMVLRYGFGNLLTWSDKVLTFFEEWTLFVAVIVALIALFINVILRYGFNYSLAWSEELVREVIIYTTLIGCSAAVKNRSMIKIDAVVQLAPGMKRLLTYFSNFVTLIFSVMIFYYGWLMAQLQVQTNQKTIILKIPTVFLYSILPLMGIMMFVRTIQVIYQDINNAN